MAYYYEVRVNGGWSSRKSEYQPSISKELKVFHTTPKLIKSQHEHLSLDQLKEIYGEKRDSTEEVPTTDSGTAQA